MRGAKCEVPDGQRCSIYKAGKVARLNTIRRDIYGPKPRACKRKLNAAQDKMVCIVAHLLCLLPFLVLGQNRPMPVCIQGRLQLSDNAGSTKNPNLSNE